MTIVTADSKRRICIRGAKTGKKYLVEEAEDGWWVSPARESRARKPLARNRREWAGSKRGLDEHLRAMAEHGLRLERSALARQLVPPCRF